MNGFIWIGQVALAGVFLISGTLKLFASRPLMQALGNRANIHETMAPMGAKIIGLIEVVLAFGVLMPDMYTPVGVAPEYLIARLSAAGLALLMIGVGIYHARRHEHAVLDATFCLMALFVIVGRWPY
ncbi:MAG: DoxX family protein [Terracidiphilus sp.]|jgi:predicted phage tail protein